MHADVRARLVCPACHATLTWQDDQVALEGEVLTATASCRACSRDYTVRDGVGVFLTDPSEDIWRDSSAGLDAALSQEPAIRDRLLASPTGDLNGADLVFRGMVLEARDQTDAASAAFGAADAKLYGAEQRACRDQLLAAAVTHSAGADWILDIASGRGTLVELLARAGLRVVASDLSPVVMTRLRARLVARGLGDLVDCIAADAAALPFADAAVPAVTTYVGLQNIADPQPAMRELRRVSHGPMRTIDTGYPPDDTANRSALAELGFTAAADRDQISAAFTDAGWRVAVLETCKSAAEPTPKGEVIAGGAVDALPVAATTLDWYLIETSPA